MTKYLFFDTETTGLPKNWKVPVSDTTNWPRLVQIAWVVTDDTGNILMESDYVIYPSDFTIPIDASKIHGITTELAKQNGVELNKVLIEFNSLLDEVDYVVAHNLDFDKKIIGAEFYRAEIETNLFEKIGICTMQSSTSYCALPGNYGYKWPTLSELHLKLFGETFVEAHNAVYDIKATRKCFWKLIDLEIISIGHSIEPRQSSALPQTERHIEANATLTTDTSEDVTDCTEYIELWNSLSIAWKTQIQTILPREEDNDYYFPFLDGYSPDMLAESSLNNNNASRLRNFFLNTTSFETGSEVLNLVPLTNFKNLEHLVVGERYHSGNFGNKNIKSLEELQQLRSLISIDCQSCPIANLDPLRNLGNLKELNISHTKTNSLEPLKSLTNLKSLKFTCAPVNDISDIATLKNLESLAFGCTTSTITNIDMLANLTKLKELSLSSNPIKDLTPLRNLVNLESLNISSTNVSDLEPISNLKKIKYLWIDETNVRSLKHLTNMKELVRLGFDKTQVTDITPILDLPKLSDIDCVDCKLTTGELDKLRRHYPNASISHYETKQQNSGCLNVFAVAIGTGLLVSMFELFATITFVILNVKYPWN
ncbi:MAG: hypothetical protein K9G41_12155 [Flavobacteriales bacterium]|nr:hypothetical protein [Flavobacteriales bacterium]